MVLLFSPPEADREQMVHLRAHQGARPFAGLFDGQSGPKPTCCIPSHRFCDVGEALAQEAFAQLDREGFAVGGSAD